MRNVTKIQEEQFDAALAESLDQIAGYTDAAFGNSDCAEAIERIVPDFVILPHCQAVTMQPQEGAVVTDDKVFHYVTFALSGNLSGLLIISLDKSTSISGQ